MCSDLVIFLMIKLDGEVFGLYSRSSHQISCVVSCLQTRPNTVYRGWHHTRVMMGRMAPSITCPSQQRYTAKAISKRPCIADYPLCPSMVVRYPMWVVLVLIVMSYRLCVWIHHQGKILYCVLVLFCIQHTLDMVGRPLPTHHQTGTQLL